MMLGLFHWLGLRLLVKLGPGTRYIGILLPLIAVVHDL